MEGGGGEVGYSKIGPLFAGPLFDKCSLDEALPTNTPETCQLLNELNLLNQSGSAGERRGLKLFKTYTEADEVAEVQ